MAEKAAEKRTFLDSPESLLTGFIIFLVFMIILPAPAFMLDLLYILNFTVSILMFAMSIRITNALEFSVLPSVLLLTALLRLALNISASRWVLSEGFAGRVVDTFANMVIREDYVVGVIIFLILALVQFIVMTKGSERIAEVAARFTLDAMPGKQMAIDSDLNAGLITDSEARSRRKAIQLEADFYGAMDGAAKFIKGDALASLIIALINAIGGFIIGITRMGLTWQTASQTYLRLTIGVGLASQIPALLIAAAAGIVVTRAAAEGSLGSEVSRQFIRYPQLIDVTAAVVLLLGLVSGMPFILSACVALILFMWGRQIKKVHSRRETADYEEERAAARVEESKKQENAMDLLQVDPMELEIGYGLIPLVDAEQGGDLLERVTIIRRQIAQELGLIVPPIRIRDNMQLKPSHYVIKIKGLEVAEGDIHTNYYLAMDAGAVTEKIDGIPTTEPAFNLPTIWIHDSAREEAELAGYTVVDPPSVLATHLSEIIKSHAHELIGRQEVQAMLAQIKRDYPAVVEELVPKVLTLGEVQKVLAGLLREGVPIRNLVTILETLADYGRTEHNTDQLIERVREALARQITYLYKDEDKVLRVITLDPRLEEILQSAVRQNQDEHLLQIDPRLAQKINDKLTEAAKKVAAQGYQPVVLCSPQIRLPFRRLTERVSGKFPVISYNEVLPGFKVKSLGMVEMEDAG